MPLALKCLWPQILPYPYIPLSPLLHHDTIYVHVLKCIFMTGCGSERSWLWCSLRARPLTIFKYGFRLWLPWSVRYYKEFQVDLYIPYQYFSFRTCPPSINSSLHWSPVIKTLITSRLFTNIAGVTLKLMLTLGLCHSGGGDKIRGNS